MSGVMTIPMIGGLFVSSTVSGQVITRTGTLEGLAGRGRCAGHRRARACWAPSATTPTYWHVAVFMALLGLGVGMMMQNLVLCHAEPGGPRRPRRRQLGGHLLPLPRRRDRRLGAGRGAGHRVTALRQGRPGRPRPEVRAALRRRHLRRASPTWTRCPRRCARSWRARTATASRDVFLYAAPFALLALLFAAVHQGGPAEDARARWRRPRRRTGFELSSAGRRDAGRADRGRRRDGARGRRHGAADAPAVRRDSGTRLRPRRRERARPAGRRHADLARRTSAGPLGRAGRRLLRAGRAGRRARTS